MATSGRSAPPSNRPRLYNLDADIGERTNVADHHPEIVARLQALANKMTAEIGGSSPTARRPAGEVTKAQTLYPTEVAKPGAGKKPKPKTKSGPAPADKA